MTAPKRLDEIFLSAPARSAFVGLPDDVSVTFDLHGDGGGTWTVSRNNGETAVRQIDMASPDCRIRCTVGDFLALLQGDLDVRHAFGAGRFDVQGDVGLALRLSRRAR